MFGFPWMGGKSTEHSWASADAQSPTCTVQTANTLNWVKCLSTTHLVPCTTLQVGHSLPKACLWEVSSSVCPWKGTWKGRNSPHQLVCYLCAALHPWCCNPAFAWLTRRSCMSCLGASEAACVVTDHQASSSHVRTISVVPSPHIAASLWLATLIWCPYYAICLWA